MTHRARLVLGGLVVERGRTRRRSIHIRRMASEAQEVDVVDLQEARIGRSVRRMARKTAFIGFHRSVLENERPHRVGVAFGADCELTCCGSNLVTRLGTVGIVAVTALDESDIDTMPVRPREFRLLRGMAAVAQGSLRLRQQEIDVCRPVWAVTGRTTDTIGQVFRVGKVLRFQAGLVALRTDRCRLGGTQRLKTNDLGDIAAAVNVRLARPVTSLASMLIALEQSGMRRTREVLVPQFLVTCLANVGFGVLAASRSRSAAVACGAGLLGCSCARTVTVRQQAMRNANMNDKVVLRLR